jgi:hypothetical protein
MFPAPIGQIAENNWVLMRFVVSRKNKAEAEKAVPKAEVSRVFARNLFGRKLFIDRVVLISDQANVNHMTQLNIAKISMVKKYTVKFLLAAG